MEVCITSRRVRLIPTMMLADHMSTVTSLSPFLTKLKKFPCYKREFVIKRFDCLNKFYLSFRENPSQSCPNKVVEMSQCREFVNEDCLAQADPKSSMYKTYQRIRKEPSKKDLVQEYCRDAGIFIPYMSKASLKRIGCSVDYYVGRVNCAKEFQRKWRHNRGSKSLCKEHYGVKKCYSRLAAQHCSAEFIKQSEKRAKEYEPTFGLPFNPFCVGKQTQP
eukprot:Seg2420.3 transcript_id=Seg2420.3/GoldUCD/mRNA.D3Y31 product="hypothetical protein" protein_id=Seg2420.3/GoldUCD/D3Y31